MKRTKARERRKEIVKRENERKVKSNEKKKKEKKKKADRVDCFNKVHSIFATSECTRKPLV